MSARCPSCDSAAVAFSTKRQRWICADCEHSFQVQQPTRRRRVFLSYGHDEHAPLAEQLRLDLEAAGHEIWFDAQELAAGTDWEHRIAAGLDWGAAPGADGCLVLLMTPHAVRRPDGFCLNELTRAQARRIPVLPVMLVECEPPLSICRTQWLDMRDCVPLPERQERYVAKLGRLREALELDKVDFEGAHAHLLRNLQPLPFDADAGQHVARFVGRRWLTDRIDAWLADPSGQRILWLTGQPGAGKSALAAWLAHTRQEVVAFHMCVHGHVQKSDARRCVLSVAYQLASQLPDYAARLVAMPLAEVVGERDARTLFDQLIVQPLSAGFSAPPAPLVVVIDALDEATHEGRNDLAHFLASEVHKAPRWLRFFVTSRPDPEVAFPMQGLAPLSLERAQAENRDDVRRFLDSRIHGLSLAPEVTATTLATLLERSDGNFLYLEYVLREFEEGRWTLDDLADCPRGLGGVFAQYLVRQFPDPAAYGRLVRPLLEAVAAARAPLPVELLAPVLGWDEYTEREVMSRLGSLFITEQRAVRPFHRSLVDWLTDPDRAGSYFVSVAAGHRRLAEGGLRAYQGGATALGEYFLLHLPAHLRAAQAWDDLARVLTDFAYVEVRSLARTIPELTLDYEAAIDAFPEGSAERTEREADRVALDAWVRALVEQARNVASGFAPAEPTPPRSRAPLDSAQIDARALRLRETPTRRDRVAAFARFVREHGHALSRLGDQPGFAVQTALNGAAGGPVEESARGRRGSMRLLLDLPYTRPAFAPLPALQQTLPGHTQWILGLCATPDLSRVASGGADGWLRVWMLPEGRCKHAWQAHRGRVWGAAMTPDGHLVVSSGDDRMIRIWDLDSGDCQGEVAVPGCALVACVDLTADGRRAVSAGSDRTLSVWEIATGRLEHQLRGHRSQITCVGMDPGGRFAVTGSYDETLRLWDLAAGKELRSLASPSVPTAVRLLPGPTAVASYPDFGLRTWDLRSGALLRELPVPRAKGSERMVDCIGVTPDGRTAVSGSPDGSMSLWDLPGHACIRTLERLGSPVRAVVIAANGATAVTGSSDGAVRVWDLHSGQQPSTTERHGGSVMHLSMDESVAMTASWDRTLRIWRLEDGACLRVLRGHSQGVVCGALLSDGRAASGGADGTLRIWPRADGAEPSVIEAHKGSVMRLAVDAAGGRILTAGGDGLLRIWGLDDQACRAVLSGHSDWVYCCAFVPGRDRVVSASRDGSVRVWDASSGRCLHDLHGGCGWVGGLAVRDGGALAVSGSKAGPLHVWDLQSGALLQTLAGHEGWVGCVLVDGSRVLSAGDDGTVRIWDLASGAALNVLRSDQGRISCLALAPDGLVVAGDDRRSVRVWDVTAGRVVAAHAMDSAVTDCAASASRVVITSASGSVRVARLQDRVG